MTPVRSVDLLAFVVVTAIWGFNFAFAKWGLAELPPIFLMALRWGLVALLLVPFVRLPRDRLWSLFLVSVTLGGLHFSVMFTGLKDLPASTAAIAIQLQVPFAAVLAAVLFRDALGWRRALGMAIAFAGVALIAGEPEVRGDPVPLVLVIVAACLWSVANVQIKLMGPIDGFVLNAAIGLFAAPQLLLASWLLEDGQWAMLQAATWKSAASILYQAILVVLVAYGLWFRLVHRYAVNQAMPFMLLVPVFGVLSGVLMLGESPGLRTVLGGLVTIAGVAIIILRRPRLAGSGPGAAAPVEEPDDPERRS